MKKPDYAITYDGDFLTNIDTLPLGNPRSDFWWQRNLDWWFSPTESHVITYRSGTYGAEPEIRIWDLHQGRQTAKFRPPDVNLSLNFLPGTNQFLCVTCNGFWIYELDRNECVVGDPMPFQIHNILGVTPDTTKAAVQTEYLPEGKLMLWDIRERRILHQIKGFDYPYNFYWSSDGSYFAVQNTYGDERVPTITGGIWNAGTGQRAFMMPNTTYGLGWHGETFLDQDSNIHTGTRIITWSPRDPDQWRPIISLPVEWYTVRARVYWNEQGLVIPWSPNLPGIPLWFEGQQIALLGEGNTYFFVEWDTAHNQILAVPDTFTELQIFDVPSQQMQRRISVQPKLAIPYWNPHQGIVAFTIPDDPSVPNGTAESHKYTYQTGIMDLRHGRKAFLPNNIQFKAWSPLGNWLIGYVYNEKKVTLLLWRTDTLFD